MWVNPLFDDKHRDSAISLVRGNPLATVIVGDPIRIAHVPVLIEEDSDGALELVGHMPRADPVSAALAAGSSAIVVFHGARSYVSPEWYTTPGLPTYNYLVAHVEGSAKVMDDPEELRSHLLDLIDALESSREDHGVEWTPDQIAAARMEQLMPLILGFRIPVTRIQVKTKVGQNRSVEDQISVAKSLVQSDHTDDKVIAQRMQASAAQRREK